MFVAVTSQDLANNVSEYKRKIQLAVPIRNIGTHMVVVEIVKTMVVEQK